MWNSSLVLFKCIVKIIRQKGKYITIGGVWSDNTYIKNGVAFQILDEGSTKRVYVRDKLDVYKYYNNEIEFKKGGLDEMQWVLEKLKE